MTEEDKRTASIRVRLSPGQMERLVRLGKRLGMPPATLGALGVNRFLDEEWSRIHHMESRYEGDFYVDEDGDFVEGDDGEPLRRDSH